MIQGGWICRGCWMSNRPNDDRCYRCKAERDPQVDVAVFTDRPAAGSSARGRRLDTELPFLVLLVSLPMWLSGGLAYIAAVLLVVAAVLGVVSANVVSGIVLIVGAIVAALIGSLWLFISRRVRRNARWAYALAAVAYVLPTAPSLLGLVEVPEAVGLPDWYLVTQTVIGLVYVLLGICAVFLLILSFMRTDTSARAPSAETG